MERILLKLSHVITEYEVRKIPYLIAKTLVSSLDNKQSRHLLDSFKDNPMLDTSSTKDFPNGVPYAVLEASHLLQLRSAIDSGELTIYNNCTRINLAHDEDWENYHFGRVYISREDLKKYLCNFNIDLVSGSGINDKQESTQIVKALRADDLRDFFARYWLDAEDPKISDLTNKTLPRVVSQFFQQLPEDKLSQLILTLPPTEKYRESIEEARKKIASLFNQGTGDWLSRTNKVGLKNRRKGMPKKVGQ